MKAPTSTYGFYVVWSRANCPPIARHPNCHAATAEAERLAAANPNQSFYVLRAESVSRSSAVTTVPIHWAPARVMPWEL